MRSTDRAPIWRPFVVGAVAVAAITGLLAGTVPGPLRPLLLALVVATAVCGLYGGAFAGLLAGTLASSAVLALPHVTNEPAVPRNEVLAVVLLLVASGWLAGIACSQVRLAVRAATTVEHLFAPADGSLGLLPLQAAELRAEEEMIRARQHQRPFSVVLLRLVPNATSDRTAYARARRAAARVLEAGLDPTAVPFEVDEHTLGALLPEVSPSALKVVAEEIERKLSRTTYADRAAGERRPVLDVLEVELAGVDGTRPWPGARAMIDAAASEVVESRQQALEAPGQHSA